MRRDPWRSALSVCGGSEAVHFVADAHLEPATPEALDRLCALAGALAGGALVLLGDTFNLYRGAETLREPFLGPLLAALRQFTGRGGAVYFVVGNRDYLVGSELPRATGALLAGEALVVRSGAATVYACHGDQLCTNDRGYQRLKRVIRDPAAVAFYRGLPRFMRRFLVGGVRRAAVFDLERKPPSGYTPVPAALKALFARGADAVVSGHRHVRGTTEYRCGERRCLHVELPSWSASSTAAVLRQGTLSFDRYGEGGEILCKEVVNGALGREEGRGCDRDRDSRRD